MTDAERQQQRKARKAAEADQKASMSSTADGKGATLPSGAAHASLRVGQKLGRYALKKVLGQGGMGIVYLAHDTQLDRPVALKIPHFLSDTGERLDRFYREAKAAATLRHANICPTYDVGEIDGVHYITMAYLKGEPLSKLTEGGKAVQAEQVAQIVKQLADALHEAHRHGVVHRDLKPANIMMIDNLQPVIMDFGVARRVKLEDADETRLTISGTILGTPAYMPPEQVAGDVATVGPASDIYSLGVVMYELLTGKLPFEGPVGSVLGQIMTVEARRPSDVYPEVERQLEAICSRAMAKRVEDRYGSMAEIAFDLQQYLQSTRGGTVTPTPSSASAAGASSEADKRKEFRPSNSRRELGSISPQLESAVPTKSPPIASRPKINARKTTVALGLGILAVASLLVGLVVWPEILDKVLDKDGHKVATAPGPNSGSVSVGPIPDADADNQQRDIASRDQTGQPSAASAKDSPRENADERELTEWLLRVGANVRVRSVGGQEQELSPLSPLPEALFHVTQIEIQSSSDFTNDDVARLRGLPHIEDVVLERGSTDDDCLAHLAALPELKALYLNHAGITGRGLHELTRLQSLGVLGLTGNPLNARFLSALPASLGYLAIDSCDISDDDLAHLAQLGELEVLDLGNNPIDGSGVGQIKSLQRLKALTLYSTRINDEGLATIAKTFPDLVALDVLDTGISDVGLATISDELPRLTNLRVQQTKITNDGLGHLARLVSLNELSLADNSNLSDEGIAKLAKLRNLHALDLRNTSLGDEGLRSLDAIPNLIRLQVAETRITDSSIDALLRRKNLEELHMSDTQITKEGYDRLKRGLPNCQIDWVSVGRAD